MADAVIRGQFDVSDIMSSLNTLYAEIKKNNKTPLLDNVDKEVKAIERLAQTIQAQATKGFTNDKEFKAYESNLNKLETMVIKVGQSFDRVNTKNLEIEIKNIKDSMKNLKEEADKLAQSFSQTLNGKFTSSKGVDFKEVNKGIAEAAAQGKDFAEALKLMRNYYDELAKSATKSIFNGNTNKYNAYKNNQDYIPATGLKVSMFNNISGKMDEHQNLRDAFVEIAKQGKTAEESVKAFNNAIVKLGTSVKDGKSTESVKKLFTDYTQKLKSYENQVQQARQVEKEYSEERNKNLALLAGTEKSYRAAQAAGIKLQNQSTDAEQKARDAYNQNAQAINNANKANQQYIDTARKSAEETKTAVTAQTQLNNTLDRLRSRVTYVLSLTNVYYQLRRVLTQTLNDVNNIDKAFASIAMVTEKTVNGLWEHYSEYAQLAQKLGQSTESAIKTSALFYQQGLKDAEVMRLTEDTMKLATLAGLDFEKATSQMTAALRGFHMEMENSSHVTDVYSELAAHAAADVNGIAYAMSKTASIANNAGMSFENTAAFLTQMIETTQEAPENIGTALKTIIARFTEL